MDPKTVRNAAFAFAIGAASMAALDAVTTDQRVPDLTAVGEFAYIHGQPGEYRTIEGVPNAYKKTVWHEGQNDSMTIAVYPEASMLLTHEPDWVLHLMDPYTGVADSWALLGADPRMAFERPDSVLFSLEVADTARWSGYVFAKHGQLRAEANEVVVDE